MTWALILFTVTAAGFTTTASAYFRNKDFCDAAAAKVVKALAVTPIQVTPVCVFIGVEPQDGRTTP